VRFGLVAPASAAAACTAAGSALLRLIAIPAVNRAIAARLKRHRRLLSATGAHDRRPARLGPLVSATAPAAALFVLLRLTAWFAALGRRISALLEERLVFGRKREYLPAVTTGELLIASHGESSFPLYVIILYFRGFRKPPQETFFGRARPGFRRSISPEILPLPSLPVQNGMISLPE
jgi:hypothetical protein